MYGVWVRPRWMKVNAKPLAVPSAGGTVVDVRVAGVTVPPLLIDVRPEPEKRPDARRWADRSVGNTNNSNGIGYSFRIVSSHELFVIL